MRKMPYIGIILLGLMLLLHACSSRSFAWKPLHGMWDAYWPTREEFLVPPARVAADKSWTSFQIPGQAPGREGRSRLWLRTRLPDPQIPERDPMILFFNVDQVFSVWLDEEKIYSFGDVAANEDSGFYIGTKVHEVSLPSDYAGRTLYLQVLSIHYNIGPYGNVHVGERADIFLEIIKDSAFRLALAATFFVVGFILLLANAVHRIWRPYGAFALFILISATNLVAITPAIHLFFDASITIGLVAQIGLGFILFPLCLFLADVFAHGKKLLTYLGIFHAVLGTGIAFLEVSEIVPRLSTMVPWQIAAITTCLILVGLVIREVLQGDPVARVVSVGIAGITIGLVFELLFGMQIIEHFPHALDMGLGVLVGSLAWVAMRHVRITHETVVNSLRDRTILQERMLQVVQENLSLREQRQRLLEAISAEGMHLAAQTDFARLVSQVRDSFTAIVGDSVYIEMLFSDRVFFDKKLPPGLYPIFDDGKVNTDAARVLIGPCDSMREARAIFVRDPRDETVLAMIRLGRTEASNTVDGVIEDLRPLANSIGSAIIRTQLEQAFALLNERTQTIRTIMENANLGILLIDSSLRILPEHSPFLNRLFLVSHIVGRDLPDLMREKWAIDEETARQIRTRLEATIGFSAAFAQGNFTDIPRQLTGIMSNGERRIIEADWIPLADAAGDVERLLVILRDVTELRALQIRATTHDRDLEILYEVTTTAAHELAGLFDTSRQLLTNCREALGNRDTWGEARRALHTLKGNASVLGLTHLRQAIHCTENTLATEPNEPSDLNSSLDEMDSIFQRYVELSGIERALGGGHNAIAEGELMSDLVAWLNRSLNKLCMQISCQRPRLAVSSIGDLCLSEESLYHLRTILSQILRNCLIHGLTGVSDPLIEVQIQVDNERVFLSVSDNGRGLDLKSLQQLTGISTDDDNSLAMRIFTSGVSTISEVTEFAGHGVGMDVVKSEVDLWQGQVDVVFTEPARRPDGCRRFSLHLQWPRERLENENISAADAA